MGVWQPRVRSIHKDAFVITNGEPEIVLAVKSILEDTLGFPVYYATVKYPKGKIVKIKHRIVLWSRSLMEFLRCETKENTSVPSNLTDSCLKRRNYIRGFFDSSACITYSPHSLVTRGDKNYARIIITRSNRKLLRGFAGLLEEEGLNPSLDGNVLGIGTQKDIQTVLRRGLMCDDYKMRRLRELYTGEENE